jgi:hypothetical protein
MKALCPLLLAFNAALPFVIVSPSQASADCESSVMDAGRRISSTGAQVYRIEKSQITGYNLPVPYEGTKPQELIISLGNIVTAIDKVQAKRGDDVMSSPALKMSIATSVLSACDGYKALTIKLWGSDWITTYFKMPSGAVREASCIPPGASGENSLMWGYQVCY